RDVEAAVAPALRDAEPATEIEHLDVAEALRGAGQRLGDVAPALRIEDAAPGMGVQADDARAGALREPCQLVELEQRNAELGMHPRRLHVLVVPPPLPGIKAHEQV